MKLACEMHKPDTPLLAPLVSSMTRAPPRRKTIVDKLRAFRNGVMDEPQHRKKGRSRWELKLFVRVSLQINAKLIGFI